MDKPFFKVKKLREEAKIPSKREEDAAYDFYGCFDEHFKLLMPGELTMIPTGLSSEIPKDWVLYLAERGSTGSKGIAKRCGIIDSGFRGEIFVVINNTSNKPVVFANHEGPELGVFLEENNLDDVTIYPQSKGIAQGMLFYCPHVEVEEVTEMSESERGEGALGSSNK
jgi:dUTP pyrophosphatase